MSTEVKAPEQQPTEQALTAPTPRTLDHQNIGIIPRTFEDGWRFSKLLASSDLAPKDYKDKPANVLVAIQMGAELGLSPMAALQNIAVINGRPSLWGDAALAVVQVHREYVTNSEYFEGTGDSKVAVFEITRKGHAPHITRFSVGDAKKAGLWGKDGPWSKYPDRMLQMRARGFGLRDKFADALRGLSIAEEALDIPPNTIEGNGLSEALPEKSNARLTEAMDRAKQPVKPELSQEELRNQAKAANEELERRRAAEGVQSTSPKQSPTSSAETVPATSGGATEPQGVELEFGK